MRSILLIFLLSFLFSGCSGDKSTEKAPPLPAEQRAAIESRLIGELSPSNDRSGRERNDMINYAIDEIWDVRPAPEGYFYQVIEPGKGEPLMEGDLAALHYTGQFLDKTTFADSKKSRRKLDFFVGQMIPAWNLALTSVKPGATIRLLVPSELAYGAEGLVNGRGDTLVGAHQVLVFELSEIEVKERALEQEW